MNKCKNCKHQGSEQYGLYECDYVIGMESRPKSIDQNRAYSLDDYEQYDYEQYSKLLVGSEFGCVNFERIEKES